MLEENKEARIIYDGDNFDEWEMALKIHLRSKKCYRALTEEKPIQLVISNSITAEMVSKRDKEIEKYNEMDEEALGRISERIHAKFHNKIVDCLTAKECFKIIKEINSTASIHGMIRTRAAFTTSYCAESDDVTEYLGKLEGYQRKLKGTQAEIGSTELIVKIMATLPQSWKAFTDSLRARPHIFEDYDAFATSIIQESFLKEQLQPKEVRSALKATTIKKGRNTSKARFEGSCHNCGKKGHKMTDCWAPGGGKEGEFPRNSQ